MLAWVRYWNQRRLPLKASCYRCRPNYQLSLSFHTSSSLHSVVRGWLLVQVKTAASTLVIQYPSDTNSGVRSTVRKYVRTTATTAWVVGGLSSDHPHSRGRQIDWIHHLGSITSEFRSNSASVLPTFSWSRYSKGCGVKIMHRLAYQLYVGHWCRYSSYMLCQL